MIREIVSHHTLSGTAHHMRPDQAAQQLAAAGWVAKPAPYGASHTGPGVCESGGGGAHL